MSFLQIICFLLLGSFVVEGRTVKEVVYQRTDTGPLSQSIRISWYRFLIEDRPRSPLEKSEQIEADQVLSDLEEGTEVKKVNDVDKILFGKGVYSKGELFKSLVTGKAGWLCYGVCRGDVGFCNDGCSCSGGFCTPNGRIDRLIPHYGSSRPISLNEEPNEVNSLTEPKVGNFQTSIGSKGKVNTLLPDCYWTACVQFNEAFCADGYKMLTKEKCGTWYQKYVLNFQTKWCCK
jgi:hypothetical protein